MFKVGDKVVLRPDVLQRHARSVPACLGYTREEFAWRDILRELRGLDAKYEQTKQPAIGVVSRLSDTSKHTNVDFPGYTIGIDNTELLHVIEIDNVHYPYDETTEFMVQTGRGHGRYCTRYAFLGNPIQAISHFNGINIGNGYKKRLLIDQKVVARAFS